jgi:hypothetical protein
MAVFPMPFRLSALPAALAGIDLAALATSLVTILSARGARRQEHPLELTFRPGGLKAIASTVLESDRIGRALVTQIRMAPFFAGIAMVIHPRAEIDAPLLVADLMIPPRGSARAYVDTCGPAIDRPTFRAPLLSVVESTRGMRRSTVPDWIAPFSGSGARLRASPGQGAALSEVVQRYVAAYLDALAAADRASRPAKNRDDAARVAQAVRTHGPASKHLARAFGADYAQRYLDLLWVQKVPLPDSPA